MTNFMSRRKRAVPDPEVAPQDVHGGERAFLYEVIYAVLAIHSVIWTFHHSVCGELSIQFRYGRERLSIEGNLWDPRVATCWIWRRWRDAGALPHVSHNIPSYMSLMSLMSLLSLMSSADPRDRPTGTKCRNTSELRWRAKRKEIAENLRKTARNLFINWISTRKFIFVLQQDIKTFSQRFFFSREL